jgi:hypothetical protein
LIGERQLLDSHPVHLEHLEGFRNRK